MTSGNRALSRDTATVRAGLPAANNAVQAAKEVTIEGPDITNRAGRVGDFFEAADQKDGRRQLAGYNRRDRCSRRGRLRVSAWGTHLDAVTVVAVR